MGKQIGRYYPAPVNPSREENNSSSNVVLENYSNSIPTGNASQTYNQLIYKPLSLSDDNNNNQSIINSVSIQTINNSISYNNQNNPQSPSKVEDFPEKEQENLNLSNPKILLKRTRELNGSLSQKAQNESLYAQELDRASRIQSQQIQELWKTWEQELKNLKETRNESLTMSMENLKGIDTVWQNEFKKLEDSYNQIIEETTKANPTKAELLQLKKEHAELKERSKNQTKANQFIQENLHRYTEANEFLKTENKSLKQQLIELTTLLQQHNIKIPPRK